MKIKRILSAVSAAVIGISLLSGCEKKESIAEETTVSETTVATLPSDLTEEEMAIWESMPDIVTMRVYNDFETQTTEILYIEKSGAIKSFISDEYYKAYKDTDWIIQKIRTSEANVADEADIHKLIELYHTCLLVDKSNKRVTNELFKMGLEYDVTFCYEVYCVTPENEIEVIFLGQTGTESYWNDEQLGKEVCLKYIEIDDKIHFFSATKSD